MQKATRRTVRKRQAAASTADHVAMFYSVDRRGHYRIGKDLGLFRENPLPYQILAKPGLATPTDLQVHLRQIFPSGLSLHGWNYMTRIGDNPVLRDIAYTPYETTLELILEYVRRTTFPKLPSRLES